MNSGKILIVEDEEDINELLKDFLVMKGYRDVTTVTKGKEALEFIKNDKPDVVFLDIVLEDDIEVTFIPSTVFSIFAPPSFGLAVMIIL